MDYSLLMMIVKVDDLDDHRDLTLFINPFVFYTKGKKFAIVMGIIDYLQVFDLSKTIQEKA